MHLGGDAQRLSIRGRVFDADGPELQAALAAVHGSAERPRCMCVPGGVEMYVALHGRYVAKRMPDGGSRHHPACASFEPEPGQSGLGELVGEAVCEQPDGAVTLRVDFAWTRLADGRGRAGGDAGDAAEVERARPRISLRGLTHFLFERAGFNRWVPAMAGKRTQGVLQRHLMQAAERVSAKGVALAERLYVPEPFDEATHADAAARRRARLSVLQPHDGEAPLAVVMAEFKLAERAASGWRVWLRHMPDAPLLADDRTWQRLTRVFAMQFEARDADQVHKPRLLMTALIRARREHTYEIDTATVMLASAQWIPVEGLHELALVQVLVDAGRRFVKPLRYDARSTAPFACALLLDAGDAPVPLHVVSAFATPREREAQMAALRTEAGQSGSLWTWHTAEAMPPLPPALAQTVDTRRAVPAPR